MYVPRRATFPPIAYYLIADRDEIALSPPDSLDDVTLSLVATLPRDLFQCLFPEEHYFTSVVRNVKQPVTLRVCYTDSVAERVELGAFCDSPLNVYLFNSTNTEPLDLLRQVPTKCLVSSKHGEVRDRIRDDDYYRAFLFENTHEFLSKIVEFRQEIHEKLVPWCSDELSKDIGEALDLLKEHLGSPREREEVSLSDFRPCRINYMTLNQLDYPSRRFAPKFETTDHSKRATSLVDSCVKVSAWAEFLRGLEYEGRDYSRSRPPVVLSVPYHPPKRIRQQIDQARKEKTASKRLLNWCYKGLTAEQNTTNYVVQLNPRGATNEDLATFAAAVQLNANRVEFIDNMGYLHSSFSLSPYLRMPMKGASLNTWLHPFELSNYKRTANVRNVLRNLHRFGDEARSIYPDSIMEYLYGYADQVVAISDLPIEWLRINGVPLAFLCDVCRLPETPLASIMAQYSLNSVVEFSVSREILTKALVVCGAPDDAAVLSAFETNRDQARERGSPARFEVCTNLHEFARAVHENQPELLIIDSHGDYAEGADGSTIQMGTQTLTGPFLVENQIRVPIVILQCCSTAPIYGREHTIAQAFFEAGSISVLATFLPITVRKSLYLSARILGNLSYASMTAVHPNWASFISHNMRTALFEDMRLRLQQAGICYDKFDGSKYHKIRPQWQTESMFRGSRASAFESCKDAVLSCLPPELEKVARNILDLADFVPEYLYYTHLGRGDLISFDVWTEDKHLPKAPLLLNKKPQ
ncbi:MAG: hypothetical protein HZB55_22855 [Deltaproteobacteria bacterium]|nr:hypothetical protein [Deltaproteobacteria bacterium]